MSTQELTIILFNIGIPLIAIVAVWITLEVSLEHLRKPHPKKKDN